MLFLGAGTSAAAGLPMWATLLQSLATNAGMNADERKALERLPGIDRARIIQGRLIAEGLDMGKIIADQLRTDQCPLTDSLLAALPIREAATMNYDTLFESAARALGSPVAVLPYEAAASGERWLLKMHGCVEHPDDIVLTREDYQRYSEQRAALAGIVQALLITRHMLFVGFSLTDDNFHRIAADVRKAVRTPSSSSSEIRPYATALLLYDDQLVQELWRGDINFVSMSPSSPEGEVDDRSLANAARKLEIFLDLLLCTATSSPAHLLDPNYDGMLTETERGLRDEIRAFEGRVAALPSEVRGLPAWDAIQSLLRRLGSGGD